MVDCNSNLIIFLWLETGEILRSLWSTLQLGKLREALIYMSP